MRSSLCSIAATAMLGMMTLAPAAMADVIVAANAGRVLDANADEVGDIGINNAGSVAIGEPGNMNEDNEGKYVTYFNPDAAARAAIGSAASITLDVTLERASTNSSANLAGFEVDLLGFENVTLGANAITPGMYEQSAVLLQSAVFTNANVGTTINERHSFDVTMFVQAEAARSGSSSIAFRFEIDPATLPIDNNIQVFWVLAGMSGAKTPTLTTSAIPEPAAVSMLALGALALARRRRQS